MNAYGLDGVIAADTALSHVDGEGGELVVCGRRLGDLASSTIAELASLLWNRDVTARALGRARRAAFERLDRVASLLDQPDGMSALQACVASLGASASAAEIAGATAVFAAAWERRRTHKPAVEPDPNLDHGLDYLRMVVGAHGDAEQRGGAMRRYLITVCDHGLNASTFTARVVTSTGASSSAAVAAAIGALSGPLHGGAPGPVLDMLESVGSDPTEFVRRELEAGRRIMGMGHRVYRARDPRAAMLEAAAADLEAAGLPTQLGAARRLESCARKLLAERYPERSLCANVELYTAVLLDALGLAREAFATTFAVGRVFGWLGHIFEQAAVGRLIRPASRYVGTMPGTPVSSR